MHTSKQPTLSDYSTIFAQERENVRLVLETIPGSGRQEQTLNVALLLLFGCDLIGTESIPTKIIRNLCRRYECLDTPHFMRTLKHADHLLTITGTRRAYVARLTPHGLVRARLLADSLLPQPQQTLKLLVVDSPTSNNNYAAFEAQGFDVFTAVTVEQASGLLLEHGLPDALLITHAAAQHRQAGKICRFMRNRSDTPILVEKYNDNGGGIPASLQPFADAGINALEATDVQAAKIRAAVEELGSLPPDVGAEIEVDRNLRVSLVHRKAVIDGKAVPLAPIEARMLHIFLRQRGQTLSDRFIGERLGYSMESPNAKVNLTVYISRLRNKLADGNQKVNYIEAQYGSGYRFISPLNTQ